MFATDRNSRPKVFCEKGVLENFAIFAGKHLCWSLFLIMLQALGTDCNFNKKYVHHRSFSVSVAKCLKNIYFEEHL